MKLTKKQLSALQRIVGREQTRYDETQSEALAGFSRLPAFWRLRYKVVSGKKKSLTG